MLYLVFSLLLVCIYRMIVLAYVFSSYKKKDFDKVKKQATFKDNWFMISLVKGVKDRYSKFEKRTIRYSRHVQVFYRSNIIHHIILFFEMICWLVADIFNSIEWNHLAIKISIGLYCFIGIGFFVFAFFTGLENNRYHKKRISK